MLRWRGQRLHTVPYCAIVLDQNRPFPALRQYDIIVAIIVSLIPYLCDRWHECHRGVIGDITHQSCWGGEDRDYILCHIVPLFKTRIALSQLQDSVVSLLQWWCHWFHVCVISDMSAIVVSLVTQHVRLGEVGRTYITYCAIVCHCFTTESSFPSARTAWCHCCYDGVIDSMSVPWVTWVPSWCHGWHSKNVMVRWRGHRLHTVPYCAIVLHQNRPFPAPEQRGVIVAMMVSLIPCLCHGWHECHRGVMGDIAKTSWWGGEDIDYILCHIVPLFYTKIALSQLQDSVSLIPCLCHRWHGWHRGVMGDIAYTSWWGGEDIDYILCHIVPLFYIKIALSQLQDSVSLIQCLCHMWHECHRGVMGDIACTSWWGGEDIYYILCHIVPFPGQCGVIVAMMVSLIPCLCHRWHECHRGVMGDIAYTSC